MLVDLNKSMLINLVKGHDPRYDQMDIPLVKANGSYAASYSTWSWKYGAFENCTEQQLWDLYQELNKPVVRPAQIKKEQEIKEIEAILEDGRRRGCQGQIDAAQEELERLRNEH